MKYHSFLIRRYLTSRFIPVAAVVAVAFGVFALISVLSVMEGFKQAMRGNIRGTLAHLTVRGLGPVSLYAEDDFVEFLESLEHVEAASPFLLALGLLKSPNPDTCFIRGIDPIRESRVGDFDRYLLRDHEIDFLLSNPESALPDGRPPMAENEITEIFSLERRKAMLDYFREVRFDPGEGFEFEVPPQPIVVGIEAIRRGSLSRGSVVKISSISPLRDEPRMQNFIVVGAFRTGLFEQDRSWIYMPLAAAQEYLDLYDMSEEINDSRFHGLALRLDDYRNAETVRQTILNSRIRGGSVDSVQVLTWEDQRETLLSAVDVEKRIIGVMMMLIVAFAGVMIFLILTVLVIEKTRDLGILRSLGAPASGVVALFLRLGMLLCVLGIVVGALAGWAFTANINTVHDSIYALTGWRLFPPQIYYFTEIPVTYRWEDWAIILGSSLVFGFLGSVIPARWASRRDPVKVLHHE